MIELNKLKPCPFCGGKPYLDGGCYIDGKRRKIDYYYIKCAGCKAKTDDLATERKAIDAWNRRINND